jgi:hypothetical protein
MGCLFISLFPISDFFGQSNYQDTLRTADWEMAGSDWTQLVKVRIVKFGLTLSVVPVLSATHLVSLHFHLTSPLMRATS